MKLRTLLAAAICIAALAPASTRAADLSLFGSFWDTDVAGDAAGGGFGLGFPLNEVFAIELRGTYFEELSDDPFENAFDSDAPIFQNKGIQVLPVDAGVRLSFAPRAWARPYVGGGVSYFLLDSDFGDIDDELGFYVALGSRFGDGQGADLFVEGIYRKATAQLTFDPEDFDDLDDLDIDEEVDLDLDGFGINLGVRWNF